MTPYSMWTKEALIKELQQKQEYIAEKECQIFVLVKKMRTKIMRCPACASLVQPTSEVNLLSATCRKPLILDACCGSLKIYQKRLNPLLESGEAITIDIRRGDFTYQTAAQHSETKIIVEPTVLADMRFLPFKDGVFSAVVCDPPHLDCSITQFMFKAYGSWSQSDAVKTLRAANNEFSRVLKDNGFLVVKTMLDRKNIFIELLKRFYFFLPVQTIRQMGSNRNTRYCDAAIWLLGIKREVETGQLQMIIPEVQSLHAHKSEGKPEC